MTAAWVAGSTRARALARRRTGTAFARRLATLPTVDAAVTMLGSTSYGHDVREGQSLAEAQHAILATLLWHVRVLAGWLPGAGTEVLRTMAGWFEIMNVEARLFGGPVLELGAMATAWPALRDAPDLRAALAASLWGDPGGSDPRAIQLGMRVSWARRAAASSPAVRPWAAGGLAQLVARERHLEGRPLPDLPADLLGTGASRSGDLTGLAQRLPADAAWALRGVDVPDDLWGAEARWWSRVEGDGQALLSGSRYGLAPVVGTVAVLAADARRVRAGLELAARGGRPREAFDAFVA